MLQSARHGSHAAGGSRTVELHHSFPLRPGYDRWMHGEAAMRLRRGGNNLCPGAQLRLRQFLRSRTKLRLCEALRPQAGLLLYKALRSKTGLRMRPDDAGSGNDAMRCSNNPPGLSLRALSLWPSGHALCASLQQTSQPQLRMRLIYPFGMPYGPCAGPRP